MSRAPSRDTHAAIRALCHEMGTLMSAVARLGADVSAGARALVHRWQSEP